MEEVSERLYLVTYVHFLSRCITSFLKCLDIEEEIIMKSLNAFSDKLAINTTTWEVMISCQEVKNSEGEE